jgi:hypothetical protein
VPNCILALTFQGLGSVVAAAELADNSPNADAEYLGVKDKEGYQAHQIVARLSTARNRGPPTITAKRSSSSVVLCKKTETAVTRPHTTKYSL